MTSRAPAATLSSTFFLVLCAPGAEKALVADATERGLRLAYSRTGVVTLKAPVPLGIDDELEAPLARFAAPCFGRAGELADDLLALARFAQGPVRLHVVDAAVDATFEQADALRASLVPALGKAALEGERPSVGDAVVTVVLVDGTPWLTLHRHRRGRAPWPGGRPRMVLASPEEGGPPSRAWLKLHEVIERFALDPKGPERALEIGAAPGGAAFLLLERGLEVVGVDPNDVDVRVAGHRRFVHVRTPSTRLEADRIGGPFHWLLVDVNVPPGTALRGALPFVAAHRDTLLGVIFTLKLKRWQLAAEIPDWVRRLERAAPRLRFTATSLWSHGQELVAVGVLRDR